MMSFLTDFEKKVSNELYELNTGSVLVKLAISYWMRQNVLMQNEMNHIIDTSQQLLTANHQYRFCL